MRIMSFQPPARGEKGLPAATGGAIQVGEEACGRKKVVGTECYLSTNYKHTGVFFEKNVWRFGKK